jgi:Pro-kumamolisin, activation domain/Bacterial Ig-like domain (group 3)
MPVDESQRTVLRGNTHPLATTGNDRGAVAPAQALNRMLILLRRSPEQDAALTSLLTAQQDPNSSLFHQWLTPEQYGAWFGPSDQDVQTMTAWLGSHGFTGIAISKGRTVIEFSGDAGQVQSAFHTAIHRYQASGTMHFANAADPSLPTALVPVVAGIVSLNDFGHRAQFIRGPTLSYAKGQTRPQVVSGANPEFTVPIPDSNASLYLVAPYDFATIYDLKALWNAGLDGTGQTIAIVGETDINLSDPEQFRAFLGLPVKNPIVTIAGVDPGVQSDETEADLDVEWSGAIAKGAQIELVSSASTETTTGVDLSALYIVDNNLAPVMSESYGDCELFLGTAGNAYEAAMWQQAAAEGITVLVSSGDEGSTSCDPTDINQDVAVHPMAVSGLASTPYNIAVGGTDFNQYNLWSTYWSSSSDPTTKQSVLGYIPEIPWNDSCGSTTLAAANGENPADGCNEGADTQVTNLNTIAGSGGPSSCISSNGSDAATCTAGWPKPAWQTGTGVPSDGVRDIPDVSMFASNGVYNSSYIVCQVDVSHGSGCDPTATTQTFLGVGGTSGSTPAMAGVMAIINQKYGRQGNANPVLYRLAASAQGPQIFHDITTDGNRVACEAQSPDCVIAAGSPEPLGRTKGHDSTVGYDMVTGLGSVDIANLVNTWAAISFAPTTTSLTLNGGTGTVTAVHGAPINAVANVSAASGNPSGDVTLIGAQPNSQVLLGTLSGGSISSPVSALPGGTYSVTARYAGDDQFAPSQSGPINVSISPEPSTTKLSILNYDTNSNSFLPAPSSVVYGSLLLVRSDVAGQSGHGSPTGSVTLADAGNTVGQFALNSQGNTEYIPNNLILAGTHSLQASYQGDPSFNASSGTANITITPASMTCSLISNTTVLRPGWTLRLGSFAELYQKTFAIPLGNMVAPGGTLTILSGSTPVVGPASDITQGSPSSLPLMYIPDTTLQISQLQSVTAPITAVYSGDSNYNSCTSTPIQLTYETGPVASMVWAELTPQLYVPVGTPVTANIEAGPAAAPPIFEPLYPAPTGTLQLAMDGVNIGSPLSLTAGVGGFLPSGYANYGGVAAMIPTSNMTAGMHTLTMNYGGDSNYLASTLAYNLSLYVPDFAIIVQPNTANVVNGQTTQPVSVIINPEPLFGDTVTFSCSGLPSGAACVFSPTSVVGNGVANLTITTTQAQDVRVPVLAQSTPRKTNWLVGVGGMSCALLIVIIAPRRWRKVLGLCVAAILGFTFGVASCGGGSNAGGSGGGGGSPSTTATSLTATTSTPAKGASDTFTATVTSGSTSSPTGTVQFSVNGSASGSPVALGNATAQFITSFATGGTYAVSAAYSGDASHDNSASSPLTIKVPYTSGSVPGTYPVTITATSGTLSHTANLTLTVQ